jgi:predicted phosphodiesterase
MNMMPKLSLAKNKNNLRVAFFADLYIQGNKLQVQTDVGAPSKYIPKQTQKVLNDINPDLVFGLGDLTAVSSRQDWRGYKKWLSGINAPVLDIFGNHDRNYTVFNEDNYGEEYFSLIGRIADTKAVKIGNQIFIFISEEHNPEGDENLLTSTIPEKRFRFIEKILKKYSSENNVFVLSHTLLKGTTALSNEWSFNDTNDWQFISEKMMNLFKRYPVIGHLTGHTHIDYRYRAWVKNIDGTKRDKKDGKFVDGRDIDSLPNNYFLNMACVDVAHGWFGCNFAFLRELGKTTAKSKQSPLRKLYMKYEEHGPELFDMFYKTPWGRFIGRGAVYYIDFLPGQEKVNLVTRWLAGNKDVETYPLNLNKKVDIGQKNLLFFDSDLSIRNKKNLSISRDDWFTLAPKQGGQGEFSKFFSKAKIIKGVKIEAVGLKNHQVQYRGSKNGGKNWSDWGNNSESLGKVNAIWLKINFQAGKKQARIIDIKLTD